MAKAKTSEMTPQDKINKVLADWSAVEMAATEGPWAYRGHNGVDYECEECGEEFPVSGYSVESLEQYQVLKCYLFGMEKFAKRDGEFISKSRTMVPKLIEAVRVLNDALNHPDIEESLDCDCGYFEDGNHTCIKCTFKTALAKAAEILEREG